MCRSRMGVLRIIWLMRTRSEEGSAGGWFRRRVSGSGGEDCWSDVLDEHLDLFFVIGAYAELVVSEGLRIWKTFSDNAEV
jgi:hypothetical protein